MKKKIIILCMCSFIAIGAMGAFANGSSDILSGIFNNTANEESDNTNLEAITEENTQESNTINNYIENNENLLNTVSQLAEYLKNNLENETRVAEILSSYLYFQEVHKFSNEQMEYIADLIINGADAEDVIDVTNFWLDTNEDISVIGEIYQLRERYSDSMFWIENAFNRVTDNKYGELTSDDIGNYIKLGLSIDDISTANVLSRKGVYTIQEILQKRLGDEIFVDISSEIINIDSTYPEPKVSLFSAITNKNSDVDSVIITECEEFALLSEVSPLEVLENASDIEEFKVELRDMKNEKYIEILNKLQDLGILSSDWAGDINE